MREVLLIFRKDVKHLWPRALSLLLFTAVWGWLEGELFAPSPLIDGVRGLWAIGAAYLGACVIHEEPLPGDRQYWLTRPFSRTGLLLAKLLFLAVFVVLPVVLLGAAALVRNGVSPWRHLDRLGLATLIFAGGVAVVVAALAAITESLVQLLWGLLPAAGLVSFGLVLANARDSSGDWQWGSLEWMRTLALGVIVVTAAVAVIAVQYGMRRTMLSRVLLAVAILPAAAGPFLGSWHGAWTIRGRSSARADTQVRVRLDLAPRPPVRFGEMVWTAPTGETGISLPIRVDGVPEGAHAVSERIAVHIESPAGQSWTSAWMRRGGLYSTTPFEDPYVIRGNGAYREYVSIDDAFYQTVKDAPVRLHAVVAVTLLGRRKTAPLATRSSNQYRSGNTTCQVVPGPFAKLLVSCAWLGATPARSYVTAMPVRNGPTFASLIAAEAGSPIPWNGSVWDRASTLFAAPPGTHEMDLETWEAVARFDRVLDVSAVRLAAYAVPRITDAP